MSITTANSAGSGTSISGKDASTSSLWIYKPWIRLVVGCGAWSAPLLLVTSYVAGSKAAGWSFACFYRAEDLMSTTPGAELSAMVSAREESEARLGAEARGLSGKLSKLLSEALSLPPSAFPHAGG
jgi:hypothetical protein